MWCNLFYDKYIGDVNGNGYHHNDNPITGKVGISDLEDGSYNYYVGKKALQIYNDKFKNFENYIIPECAYTTDMFKLKIYTRKEGALESIYVIISVNTSLLETCIKNKEDIPNLKFLTDLCLFHSMYTEPVKFLTNGYFNNNNPFEQKVKQNIDYIIENVSKPVDYTFDSRINDLEELNIKLFEYQKCSVNWMINKEKNKDEIKYNINDEIVLGNVYYDVCTHNFDLIHNKKKIKFDGGAVIDEVGLGKTLQVISLGLSNPASNINYTRPEVQNKFCSKATLIFCPNQLCGTWIREIKDKIHGKYEPSIVKLLTKVDFDKLTYQDLLDADFVVVSYTFLGNASFTQVWASLISRQKSFVKQKWKSIDVNSINTVFTKLGKDLLADPIKNLEKKNPLIQLVHWHRFVIDEFHEIYKDESTYNYISNLLPYITADNKWCVTATPFGKKTCMQKIVDFLVSYKNPDGDFIYTLEPIIEYLDTKCFRRNTKESVKGEHTLPPIKEEIRWLKFSQTERMMYNAYLANENNDKFSVYLRQLCCHPKLAEETKEALSNCKTLADIEKMIVSHYKNEMDDAQEKVNKIQERLAKLNKKIKKLEKKQLKAQMKKKGIKVEDSDSDADSSDDDMDDIINILIGNNDNTQINVKPSITIDNLKLTVKENEGKLKEANIVLDGKKSTYNFFNNVIERLKKTTTKEKKESVSKLSFDIDDEEDDEEDDEDVCGICMDEMGESDIGVTKCGHIFCYSCLNMAVSKTHKCPYCNNKVNNNDIYVLSYEKKKTTKLSSEEKNKQDLINEFGTKLANIITFLKSTKEHTIIFSQWDDLLRRIGKVLTDNKIPNVFCRGNCYQRDKAIREFNADDKIKVIMLSSDSTAAGTNLTKASQVIFIDPIYGDYKFRKDQERQAVGRAHRLGQKSNIKVIRFIIKETVEEEIYKMNMEEDKKHKSEFESSTEVIVS